MEDQSHSIRADTAGTLDSLFRERVRMSADQLAYRGYDRDQQTWVDTSWDDMARQVARWQEALRGEPLDPGDRVALIVKNGKEWVCFEQAALGLGLVVVPLYTDDRPDNISYILNDSGAKLLLLQDQIQWRQLTPHLDELEGVKRFVIIQPSDGETFDDERITALSGWLPEPGDQPLRERGGDPDKLATIVYTSGTTGRPKGVMLSHRNILTVAQAALEVLHVDSATHLWLSFLPLSHTFERTCGYYAPMMCGSAVVYARSIQQLADDIQSQKPTVLIAVPRIFERIYERVQDRLSKQNAVARSLFNLTTNIGWRRFEIQQRRALWGPEQLLWPLLNRVVARKLQQRFGGRLRIAVSGGAALPPAIAKVFIGLGLNLVQGYGMTESAPVVSANTPDGNIPASVGKPLPGIVVRIGDNDELQVSSPGIMLGYWNNHQATSETIGKDGWLHTGDKARLDKEGFIYITGRIKDILVMSNGEKIPPGDMEQAISLDPLFEQALIVGEGKPFLSALAVLNGEHWVSLAKEHQLDPFDHNNLDNKRIHSALTKQITQCLHDFPGYAKVRRVVPLLEPWTIENGLLTPTLKIKRQKVVDRFADSIERLYTTG